MCELDFKMENTRDDSGEESSHCAPDSGATVGSTQDLVELSFEMDNYDDRKEFYASEDRDGEYGLAFPDSYFRGLTLDLASGQDLKRLQKVRLTRKGRSTMGAEETEWTREHWPDFNLDTAMVHNKEKYKDRF